MHFRPMPVLTVLTLISLAILIMLGNWQYDRYTSKLQARDDAVAVDREQIVAATIDVDASHSAQLVYGLMDGEPVWRRYVPARLDASGELVLVLWDATGGPTPVQLPLSGIEPVFARKGIVLQHVGARGLFGAKDNPEGNLWYAFDATAITANLGYETTPAGVVETFDVTVRNSEDLSQARRTRNPYALANAADPLPPERHIGYALTWLGMAIGLIVIYFALHHSRGRLRFRSQA